MIRNIIPDDVEEIKNLLIQLRSKEIKVNTENLQQQIEKIHTLSHIQWIGKDIDNKIVGMCIVAKIDGPHKPFSVIESVVVDLNQRNKGIGRELMLYAIQICKKWECYKTILETGSKKSWKLDFYRKCGFTMGEKTAFIMKH